MPLMIHRFTTWFFNDWMNICFAFALITTGIMAYHLTPAYERKQKLATAVRKMRTLQKKYEETKNTQKQRAKTKEEQKFIQERKQKAQLESKFSQPIALSEKWKHDRILPFYIEHIVPFINQLMNAQFYGMIIALLSQLDSTDCPSIVSPDPDTGETRFALKDITLFDHSLNVAEEMVTREKKALKEEAITDNAQIGRRIGSALLVSLGHDIGKIPRFFDLQKGKRPDHAYISHLGIDAVLVNIDKADRDQITTAIKDHHGDVLPGSLSFRLNIADKKAREKELKEIGISDEPAAGKPAMNEPTTDENLSWLDLDEFLSEIDPVINTVDEQSRFTAFSMPDGIVYVMPSQLLETLEKLAARYGKIVSEEKRSVQKKIKERFSQKNLIHWSENIKGPGARIVIVSEKTKSRLMFLPLKASAFKTDLQSLEARKKNSPILNGIAEVKPERRTRTRS